MAQTRGRAATAAMVAVVLLVGLAACGDDDDTETSAGQSATTAATSAPAVTTTLAAVTTTQAAALLKTATHPSHGTILVDAAGKALYTFDRDTTSTSSCSGTCAQTWPPLLLPAGGSTPTATGVTGTLGVSARTEGGSQITLNGKPLYRYAGDPNPGDVNGDGVGGNWHVAKQS